MMNLSKSSASSEIAALRQSKKLIADYVQKELRVHLEARNLEHVLTRAGDWQGIGGESPLPGKA